MSKKHIAYKELKKLVAEKLLSQTPRKVILDELSSEYYDKDAIAKVISSIPTEKSKSEFKSLNSILIFLLLLASLLKLIVVFSFLSDVSLYALPFAIIFPLINIYFAWEIRNYNGQLYKIIGLFGLMSMLKSFGGDLQSPFGIFVIAIAALISFLAFYLGKKMFPNLGLMGPKKDASGEYILE
jgi:cytochrome bd-type quinol oxidase subunit 1